MIKCTKCSGRMLVDRVFTSPEHLELFCLACGKREMYPFPEKNCKKSRWIMRMEKMRAKANGNSL